MLNKIKFEYFISRILNQIMLETNLMQYCVQNSKHNKYASMYLSILQNFKLSSKVFGQNICSYLLNMFFVNKTQLFVEFNINALKFHIIPYKKEFMTAKDILRSCQKCRIFTIFLII